MILGIMSESEDKKSHSQSEDQHDKKDPWTDEQEATLKKWGEEAKGLSWMHGKCEKWFNVWDKIIGITGGALAILVSVSIFASNSPILTVRLIQGFVAFLAGALAFAQNFLQFGKRTKGHAQARIRYELHADSIEIEMSLLRSSRESSTQFFRKRQKERAELMKEEYPPILDRYIEKYNIKFGSQNVSKPLITDVLQEIVIQGDQGDAIRPARVASDTVAAVVQRENNNPLTRYELNRYHEHEER